VGAREDLLARGPDAVRQALRQLVSHRLRTGLALSGIAVGVATVIGSTTLADARARNLLSSFERIGGVRTGFIFSEDGTYRNGRFVRFAKRFSLTLEDREYLRASLHEIEWQCAWGWGQAAVSNGRVSFDAVRAFGTGASFLHIRPVELLHGRYFTAEEDDRLERVAVVYDVLAEDLFGRTDVVGEEILVSGQRFRIVGVLRRWWIGERSTWRRLCLPFQTGVSRLGRQPGSSGTLLKIRSGASWAAVIPAIQRILVLRHPGSEPDSFLVRSVGEAQGELLSTLEAQGNTFNVVALLCLLTGAIGILNVFLVSVTERTSEIGLRMALGASRSSVLGQLFFEALVLCAIGGGAGLAAGQGVALGFAAMTRRSMTAWDFFDPETFSVSLGGKGILLALGLTLFTTVLAGTYPAWRASRLDPATALRHE
jgi:ABC-type antimicrobial peptide transport system permease subunit